MLKSIQRQTHQRLHQNAAKPVYKMLMVLAGLGHLRGLPALTHLDLTHCKGLTDQALTALQGLPLSKLNLDQCPWLSDLGLAAISGLPIVTLSLNGANLITPEGLASLRNMPLTYLSLRQCMRLEQDDGLEALRGSPLAAFSLSPGLMRSMLETHPTTRRSTNFWTR